MIMGLKSYLVFTSLFYRIAVFALMPLSLIGIGLWTGQSIGGAEMIVAAMLLPMAEILSDNWLFGGIQTKDPEKMDYLKTSGRGMGIIRRALAMDMVRRFCTALCTIGVCYLMPWLVYGRKEDIGVALYFVLMPYFFSVLGTFLSRYGSLLWLNMTIGYGASFFVTAGLLLLGLSEYILLLDLVFGVLGISASIFAVRVAMKKVEGGYYDK